MRKSHKRIDEVLDLFAQCPHRLSILLRARLTVEVKHGRLEAQPQQQTRQVGVALLDRIDQVGHLAVDQPKVETAPGHRGDGETAEQAIKGISEQRSEEGVVALPPRSKDQFAARAPFSQHIVQQRWRILQIGGDIGYAIALCQAEARHHRCNRSKIAREPDDTHARLLAGQRLQHRKGVIARAIVYEDKFKGIIAIAARHRLQLVQQIGQAGCIVIDRHHNGNQAHAESSPARPNLRKICKRSSSATSRR